MKYKFENVLGYRLRIPIHPTTDLTYLMQEYLEKGKCGPGTGLLEKIIPEEILGISVTPACKIHDLCYFLAGNIEGKVDADLELFANAFRILHQGSRNKFTLAIRSAILWFYFTAVMSVDTDCVTQETDKE